VSRLRVLHIHAGNLYGGVETLLLTLARQTKAAPDVEHRLALCFEGRLSAEIREMGASGVKVRTLGAVRASRPWTVWRARGRIKDLLKSERPDAVMFHSAWSHGLFAKVARKAKIPIVFMLHGAVEELAWPERKARKIPPDLALCVSQFVATTLPKLFPDVRPEVLYPPVMRRAPTDAEAIAMRRSLGAPGNEVVVLQIGRMEPLKGHAVLLDALARLDGTSWLCWIVGGPQRAEEKKYEAALKAQAKKAGLTRVTFLGERSDIAKLMAAADIVCQPNTGPEGFGLVFVEALLAGRPVITSDIGAAPEIVDASCGELVPAGDVARLRAALAGLIDNRAQRDALGAAGPARARSLCEPERQVKRLAEILAKGIARGAR